MLIYRAIFLKRKTFAEEKAKRVTAGYGQISFNYDQVTNQETVDEPVVEEEEPDEIFVPNPHFYVPPDIALVCFGGSYLIFFLNTFFLR